eukprot:COSAG01_NODE_52308_length_347_cov_1.125000_1_plen_64_part_10
MNIYSSSADLESQFRIYILGFSYAVESTHGAPSNYHIPAQLQVPTRTAEVQPAYCMAVRIKKQA